MPTQRLSGAIENAVTAIDVSRVTRVIGRDADARSTIHSELTDVAALRTSTVNFFSLRAFSSASTVSAVMK